MKITQPNLIKIFLYLLFLFLLIFLCIFNFTLKPSGDELSYYQLSLPFDLVLIERNWHLPGFPLFLKIMNYLNFYEIAEYRVFITIINFSLIAAISYLMHVYFNVNRIYFLILLIISPTFLFYFLSSLWADIFSSLVFCLSFLLFLIYLQNKKKSHFFLTSLILFSFCTILRPQYMLFVISISIISLIYINKNISRKKLLKKNLIWLVINILIFLPIAFVSFSNYLTYDIFLPFISPALAKLFHFPSSEFRELIINSYNSFNFYGIHLFVESYAMQSNISFGEAAKLINEKYTTKVSYLEWIYKNSISAFYIFTWDHKYVFLDRYIKLSCWGLEDCLVRDFSTILYFLETFSRALYLIILLYITLTFVMLRNVSTFLISIFSSFLIIYFYIICMNGIGLPHGRHFFELQVMIVMIFCLLKVNIKNYF